MVVRLGSSPRPSGSRSFGAAMADTTPPRVRISTRCPTRTSPLQPPSLRKKTKPSSSTCVTARPISSMWPTIASGGPDPAPTRATDEPRLSVETSAKLAAPSRQTRAASSSRPDGPRARSSASRSSGAGIARIVCGGASLASGTMRRLLLLVSAIMLVDAVFFSALTPLLPHYAETLHLSKAGAGILTGTFGVGTLVGAIPAGILSARLGPKTVALLGLGLLSATSLAFGFGGNVWVLDVARLLQGVGGACTWTSSLAWLVAFAPRERRGELLGTALGAGIAGALLGPIVGSAAASVGTRPVFAGVAVAGGVAYGSFWVPGMSVLAGGADRIGLDQSFAFALFNLAWAAGEGAGSLAGGTLGQQLGDPVAYCGGAALCLVTLLVGGLTRA